MAEVSFEDRRQSLPGTEVLFSPPSLVQRQIWMHDQLHPAQASYNVPAAFRLVGPLDVCRLQCSLTALVRCHGALRTALRLEGQNIVQAIATDVEVPLETSTLDSVPDPERLELALRSAAKLATLPFDLGPAPLMRAALYRVGEDDHVLALCFHQAIFDSWSERA